MFMGELLVLGSVIVCQSETTFWCYLPKFSPIFVWGEDTESNISDRDEL